ncbi:zinc finger protein 112-like [Atheta coriaria]|uniref:zinc finger protein 112-like n=1 Tax=Dalotia coriaria TaxID=877792 RepID=UPI0031F3C25A
MALAVDSPTARFSDLCRLCASKTGSAAKGLNIFANEANYRQIFKKIEACLPIQISETDVLPKIVCENCLFKVELLFDFRERALRTEGVLIELFKELHSLPIQILNGTHHTQVKFDAALDHVISQQNGLLNDGLSHVNDIELPQLSHRDSMIILAQHSVPLDQLSQHDINQELSNHSIDTSESILGGANGYNTMDYHHTSILHDEINLSHASMHQIKAIVDHDNYPPIGTSGVQRLMMNEAHFMHDHLNEEENFDSLNSYIFCTTCGKSFDDKILLQQHYEEHYSNMTHEKEVEVTRRKDMHGTCSTAVENEVMTNEVREPEVQENQKQQENAEPLILSIPPDDDVISVNLDLVDADENLKSEYSDADSEVATDKNKPADIPQIPENHKETEEVQQHPQEEEDQDTSKEDSNAAKKNKSKVCNVCGKQYKTNYKLAEHMRKHTGEQPYKCNSCDKAFRSKIGYTQHIATHTGKFEFSCTTCGKGFQCKSYLMVHQRVHSDVKPYQCTTCDRSFKSKQSLLDHTNRHLGVKPYACDICRRSFITKGLLKAHQSVHAGTDNRKYACPLCDKMFVSKSYLQTHAHSHTGEKPYKCEVCGKGFMARVDLKIHSTIHTGEKSYVCEICGKAFARRDALRCHRRSHTGERPYKCDICGQTFTQFSPMVIHKRLHTGERPYQCELCTDRFVSRSTMMVHLKKHPKFAKGEVSSDVNNELKNEIKAT